ncbi:hypothetical protein P4B35_15850 [Pontiellaceae bacterium B12227]|nr:hypothetical protein [Pontiellaceae bacterium B12227]
MIMTLTRHCFTCIVVAGFLGFAVPMADAGVILSYDSLLPSSGGSATALSRINSQTDSELVSSSGANNTFGNKAIMAGIHGSQNNVDGLGDQNDLVFRFGSTPPGDGILSGPLTAGHAASGPRIDFTYTAAKDQTLTDFSMKFFNNSNNASSYGARDAGLFVSVAGAAYIQFGSLFTSATGNGNHGTVTFSDSVSVGSGDVVNFRLTLTDRTRTNNDPQAGTRIGDVNISAIAEPASLGLIAM